MGGGLVFEYIPLRYPRVNLTKFLFCPQFPPKLREQSRLHIFTFGNSTYLLTHFLSKYKLSSRENIPCISYVLPAFLITNTFSKKGEEQKHLILCQMYHGLFVFMATIVHYTYNFRSFS